MVVRTQKITKPKRMRSQSCLSTLAAHFHQERSTSTQANDPGPWVTIW